MEKVVLKNKKVTYVNIVKKDKDDKYSLAVLIEKNDINTINDIKLAVENMIKKSELNLDINASELVESRLYDGAKPNKKGDVNEETKDYYLLNLTRLSQPKIYEYDEVMQDVIEVEKNIVSHLAVCDVIMYVTDYEHKGKKGISFKLGDILVVKRGVRVEESIKDKFNL